MIKYYYIGYKLDYDDIESRVYNYDENNKCTTGIRLNSIESNNLNLIKTMFTVLKQNNNLNIKNVIWKDINCNNLDFFRKNNKLAHFIVAPHDLYDLPIKIHHYIVSGLHENKIDLYKSIANTQNKNINQISYIPSSFVLNNVKTFDDLFNQIKELINNEDIDYWRKNQFWLLKDSDSSLGNRIHGFMIHINNNIIDFELIKSNLKNEIMIEVISSFIDRENIRKKFLDEYCATQKHQMMFFVKYYKNVINQNINVAEGEALINELINDYISISPYTQQSTKWYLNKYVVPFKIPQFNELKMNDAIVINNIKYGRNFWSKIQNRWMHIRCYLCPIIEFYEDPSNPKGNYKKRIFGWLYPKFAIYISNKEKILNIDKCIYKKEEIISQTFDEYERELFDEVIDNNGKLFTFDDLFEIIKYLYDKKMPNGFKHVWDQIRKISADILNVRMGFECYNNPNLSKNIYTDKVKLDANGKFTCFKILGIDMIIDTDLKVNLLEYNTGPFLKEMGLDFYKNLFKLVINDDRNVIGELLNIYDGVDDGTTQDVKPIIKELKQNKDRIIKLSEEIQKINVGTVESDDMLKLNKIKETYHKMDLINKERYLVKKYLILKKYIKR